MRDFRRTVSSRSPLPLGGLSASANSIFVGGPDFGREARRLEARQRDGVELVNLDASVGNRPHHPRISDDDPSDERPEQPLDGRRIAGRLQHHLIVEPKPSPERDDLVLHKIKALFIDQLAVFQDGNLGGRSWTSIPMTRMLPLLWFPGAGESTRHLRIRARSATGEPSFTSLLSTPS